MTATDTRGRKVSRILIAIFYGLAGIAHILSPEGFLRITPAWVPFPGQVILLTGIAELAGAAGILIPQLRRAAGIGLALYALCVWPANVKHMLDYIEGSGFGPGMWYHAPRMLAQPVLIWWTLWAAAVIDWPFGQDTSRRHGPGSAS